MRLNTLYGKISLALTGLFLLTLSLLYLIVSHNYQAYQREATQHVNRDLASKLIFDQILSKGSIISKKVWKKYLQSAMIANPNIDLYFVNTKGKILNYALHKELVVRKEINIEPLIRFTQPHAMLPIYGDNPRSFKEKKMFSAAPLYKNGKHIGYLYIILNKNLALSTKDHLHRSFIVKSTFSTLILVALFMLISTLVLFKFIISRVETLAARMIRFKNAEFKVAPEANLISKKRPDEVDKLNSIFNQLASLTIEQMEVLKTKDECRRDLVSQVCHDIRTPLTSLNGYIETLIYNDETMTQSEKKQFLTISANQCKRISKLIDNLFLASKLDDFDYKISPEKFLLSELVGDVIQKLHVLTTQKQLNFQLVYGGPEQAIYADIGMIERLLDNLIDNAIKHSPTKGTITVKLNFDKDQCILSIIDFGPGFKQNESELIFNKFYRTKQALENQINGSGLGLAICKRIADLHHSEIKAMPTLATSEKTRENQGATFQVTFKLSPLNTSTRNKKLAENKAPA